MERDRKTKRRIGLAGAALGISFGVLALAVARPSASAPIDEEPAPPAVVETAAPAPVAAAPRSVGWVGDSIGWQSQVDIEAQLSRTRPVATFDSVIGATVEAQRPAAEQAVQAVDGPDILLVELGTNDASKVEADQFVADVRRFLDGVTPHVECVRWFDVKRGGSPVYDEFNANAVHYNTLLAEVIAEYPTVRTVDYSAWADLNGPAAFDEDGVHLSSRGELALGHLAARAADLCDGDIEGGLV